jgi:subtilisin family serine protease
MPRALSVGLLIVAAWLTWLGGAGTLASPPLASPPLPSPPLAPATVADERRQHLEALGVAAWHDAEHRGAGMKVAVLDTGFRDYRRLTKHPAASLADSESSSAGVLPSPVGVRSFRPDGQLDARDSQHGLLCTEIVHAVAPRAELLFVNWDTEEPATFLAAVRWAKQQGAKIITCSVILPSWSDGEGGGPVHAELDRLLDGDVLCFASAGNLAERHWTGSFRPDAQGWHQWRDGRLGDGRLGNAVEPWGNERVSVELYGATACSCEVVVLDVASGQLIGRCPLFVETTDGRPWGRATVRFEPQARAKYQVFVRCLDEPARDDRFHLVVLGGGLECSASQCSIAFPADGRNVQAVGAVDAQGRRQPYSACGPTARRLKPDFTALVPFPTTLRDRPFSGTSAAAPQAAGLAALVWSRHPDWSAARVLATLRDSARDLGVPGQDCETGFGCLRLP